MALGLADLRIGTWTSTGAVSGCTVVLPPPGTVGAMAVRGAAPGTREAVALGPTGKVAECHAVVLSGGSAFGLATADGVMGWLEEGGVGYPVVGARVPIVGAAIVLDRAVAEPGLRPDAAAGRAACDAAGAEDPAEGGVGVGAGCSVAKVAGLDAAWRGGQGLAVRRAAGVTVGALVANNAVGEVLDADGSWVARARVPDDTPRFPYVAPPLPDTAEAAPEEAGPEGAGDGPTANTAIGCVVTDARLTKHQAHRVADLAHSGLARALRPAHTDADGDALFCLATGRREASPDLVAHLAAEVVAEAARRGPRAAVGNDGLPGLADPGRAAP